MNLGERHCTNSEEHLYTSLAARNAPTSGHICWRTSGNWWINMVIKAAAFSYSDQRASDPELHVSSQNNPPHDVLAGMTCIRRAAGATFLHFRDCVNPAGRIALQAWHHQISMDSSQSIVFPPTYFSLSRHHPSVLLPCTRSTCTPLTPHACATMLLPSHQPSHMAPAGKLLHVPQRP